MLAWAGDYFQMPTVDVAMDPVHIPLDSPAVQAYVRTRTTNVCRPLGVGPPGPPAG